MIINDHHRFAFIHIPKCGGTTVRNQLQPLDDTNGEFTSRVEEHPALGLIDYVHIPLFVLRSHFPEVYWKVCHYRTYALIRNPYERFPSSVSQYLAAYGPGPIHQLTPGTVARETQKLMEFLSKSRSACPLLRPTHIHFQPQVAYIYDEERRVVRRLFDISEIDRMLGELTEEVGVQSVAGRARVRYRANESLVFRNSLFRRVTEMVKPLLRRVLSQEKLESLRRAGRGIVYVPRKDKFADLFASPQVQNFVAEYYADDIELFRSHVANERS